MNRKDLYQSFNTIDEDILERSEVVVNRKSKPMWFKWGTMAACLAVVVFAGVFMLTGNHTIQTSVGGVMREYKNVSVSDEEEAIVWPWEYKTVYERFSTIIYEGKEYTTKTFGLAADKTLIGDNLDAESVLYLPLALHRHEALVHVGGDVRMDVQGKFLYLQFVDQVV